MNVELARTILSVPKDENSIDHIFDNDACFIWDEYGDEVEQWNYIAGRITGLAEVIHNGDADDPHFSYKGTSVRVPVLYDRGDNLLAVHSLSQLVKADMELRLCIDTVGNSEHAFMPLAPSEWRKLEAEFGLDNVKFRFLAVAPDFEDFDAAAFCDENTRVYGAAPPTEQEMLTAVFVDAVTALVSKSVSCEASGVVGEDNYVTVLIVTETDDERDRLHADETFRKAIAPLIDDLRAHGLIIESIAFESRETADLTMDGEILAPLVCASSPHWWCNKKPGDRTARH